MKSLAYINKFFFKYKWRFILGVAFVIAQNFFAIYPAQVVRKSLDTVVSSLKDFHLHLIDQNQFISDLSHKIFIFLLIIIGVALLRGFLMFMMRQTLIVMSRLIEYDLKNEIYAHYQKLTLAFYRRNNTGDLVNRISEDVSRVRMYIGPAIMYTINLIVLFILIIIIMFSVNKTLAIFVLLPLPFLSLSIYYVSDKMNRKSEDVQQQQSKLSTFVQEAFSGIRVLKSFVKEMQSENEFSKESEHYRHKSMELVKINALFFPLMLLLVGLSTLLVVYIGGKEVIAGYALPDNTPGKVTPGNIAEFIIYVNMLTWPVASLGWVTSLVQRAAASQQRINEFFNVKPEIFSVTETKSTFTGKLEFENVSFVYPDSGIKALDHVSFIVEPGKSLAVLGKTGSGKSTIANLVIRMYDPTKGRVLIDDKPIETISLESLRDEIGYVPQDVFLFSDTIADNIAFGLKRGIVETGNGKPKQEARSPKPEAGKSNLQLPTSNFEAQVKQAAQDAVIYDNIMEFPKGFQTMIGERGITLSGGQKQRISIARALIKNPKMLVFDDCLSAVDTHTEEQILNNLKKHIQGRTSLIISHRVSSVKHADQIIVLDHGKIVESGTHETLLNTRGIYFQLYERQLLEEEAT